MYQGWYLDPFERHEGRWFSAGKATSLVRDGSVESNDEPPHIELPHEPVPYPEQQIADPDKTSYIRAALDGSGAMGIGFQ